ncbi:hypothetical protein MPTK2_Ug00380 [Marchantia polymorpha subsp. ruderalis]|uniref:Uncharacterized protein n=1 Tax=Marchantia polymorpha TaxID=3197 RepID=A0A2R6XFD6_MARPO|nr:hypothetical protein MARPO_0018s0014 [Marchantia polymorpha]|eukprot:PTQ44818.1 hypothetical protein MARPO_0018s0014 [Marchantia polymorpha]
MLIFGLGYLNFGWCILRTTSLSEERSRPLREQEDPTRSIESPRSRFQPLELVACLLAQPPCELSSIACRECVRKARRCITLNNIRINERGSREHYSARGKCKDQHEWWLRGLGWPLQ